ncbi:MAG: gamma-glutamyltransferase family protein [Alphaproteobacteria bacterium]|jgi:gamma-glutamyltranspeptidase/glutathione hydrolase|nr:gamma-glutamyltransferase family protein [Alphaproteobacteria bacterium]
MHQPPFTTRPDLVGTVGMVASTHWLASAAGMAMLERGGNAFDAAVAAGFVLQVVEPHLNGPGGEVPIILYDSARELTRVISGQGAAPRAATIEMFQSLGLDRVPGTGLLAAVIPGAFDAWMLMLRDHGSLSLSDVLAPAISYADQGFPVVPDIATAIAAVAPLFRAHWPGSADLYLPAGAPPQPGGLARNPMLAHTYKRILADSSTRDGREARIEAARRLWYEGFVAEAVDRFCRTQAVMDGTGRAHRGLLTGDDMVDWRAGYERPASYAYGDLLVCKTAAWGQGPVFLQQLALLRDLDIAGMDPLGEAFVHTVVEAAKLAFADREAYYGDPLFVDVPLEALLADGYNAERRRLIGETASLEMRPGGAGNRTPRLPSDALTGADTLIDPVFGTGDPTLGTPDRVVEGDTCHVDVVDRWGNMVSATPSGGWLQSSPVIPELGFPLSTRAQMFWLDPGLPSALAPGRRPRTTLTPTLVLKQGRGALAFGTPGGDQQDQWQLAMFLRHLHHGMSLQQAIDAPAFHTAHFPASFWPRRAHPGSLTLEGRFSAETIEALRRRGHRVTVTGDWSLGRLSAVSYRETAEGPLLGAAANPRRMQGYAVGR